MAATDWDGATFEAYRPLLFSIAYRMLGSASEAEDVVQDAWLRARQDEHADVRSARAYLTTIVTRLCIDHLRSAERTRMEYPGPWLPEPLAEPNQESAELASSLTTAFLVLLEQLAPTERAVFLLREVFELDFDEIARSIGKSEPATRQILTRARGRLRDSRPRFTASRRGSRREVRARLCPQGALVRVGLPACYGQRHARSASVPSDRGQRHLLVRHHRRTHSRDLCRAQPRQVARVPRAHALSAADLLHRHVGAANADTR